MSYPTPPGSGNPYGQPPPPSGWQPQQLQPQWQGQGPVPPMPPTVPPAPVAVPQQPATPQPNPQQPYPSQPGPPQYGAYAPPGNPVPGAPVPPSGGGRTVRTVFGSLLGVFGVLGMLGGGALAAHAYNNSQLPVPNDAYDAVMWRNESAENLFPATVGDSSDEKGARWSRMGISQDTSCAKGLSGETKDTAVRLGCKAALRATYVDLTGEMVATVAIIVLPADGSKGQQMGEYLDDQSTEDVPDAAVVPLKVPGTLAAKWQDSRRNGMGGTASGIYGVAVTTGAVDGRAAANLPGDFGKYGANDEDRQPWMKEADALSKEFFYHISSLER
jgi:hypothetical protein